MKICRVSRIASYVYMLGVFLGILGIWRVVRVDFEWILFFDFVSGDRHKWFDNFIDCVLNAPLSGLCSCNLLWLSDHDWGF